MNRIEFTRTVKSKGFDTKAKKTLCGFSDGSIFIDGNLSELKKQAENSGLEFFVMKGSIQETETPKNTKDATTITENK